MPRKPKPNPSAQVEPKTVSNDEKPWQFKKGNNANPAGRPKGSRNKLEELFVTAMVDAFNEGGIDAIKKVRDNDPAVFLNVIAKILPKQVEQKVQVNITDMTDDELANIAAGGSTRASSQAEHTPLFN